MVPDIQPKLSSASSRPPVSVMLMCIGGSQCDSSGSLTSIAVHYVGDNKSFIFDGLSKDFPQDSPLTVYGQSFRPNAVTSAQLQKDRALARRVSAGDSDAFEDFFREYFPRLFRFTLSRVGSDTDLAEEVVQRTMCLVLRKMRGYRGEALLFTWLCQICRNELASVFRRRFVKSQREVPLEDNPAVQAALESLSADLESPEKSRHGDEVARFVRVTLEYLPSKYALALEMKYIRGCSVDEIGQELHISTKAAESVLTRARVAFKECFRSLWDFEPDLLLVEATD